MKYAVILLVFVSQMVFAQDAQETPVTKTPEPVATDVKGTIVEPTPAQQEKVEKAVKKVEKKQKAKKKAQPKKPKAKLKKTKKQTAKSTK